MRSWLICGAVVAFFALLAFIKLGIYIAYDDGDFRFRVLIGPFRLKLTQKKKEKAGIKAESKPNPANKNKKLPWQLWIKAIFQRWEEVLELFCRVLRMPTFDLLKIHIVFAEGEPDERAIKYGRICAVVANFLEPLERIFSITKRDVDVSCRFDKEKSIYDAEAVITLKVHEVIALLFAGVKLGLALYGEVKNMKREVRVL